jgi:(p)ppGpp synthase/HD superfamily hydrolase
VLLSQVGQTNLDLYRQLHRLGYRGTDLRRVRDAYLVAMRLFSDRFRANGKPFVAHLVGTASLLAAFGAPPDVVIAGLLHAVYTSGSFPDGTHGMTAAHRAFIRSKVGDAVETLVAAYEDLTWNRATIAEIAGRGGLPSSKGTDILLMRLANEIEDHYALGMRLCSAERRAWLGAAADCVAIAQGLGRPEVADALARVYRETAEADWAEALATDEPASFRLPGPTGMTGTQHIRAGLAAARQKLRRLVRL